MRHFGLAHARATRTERPDSVNDPLEGKLTGFQRFVLLVGCAASLVLSVSVAHGYYLWFLKP
jgi:hypothetical protein